MSANRYQIRYTYNGADKCADLTEVDYQVYMWDRHVIAVWDRHEQRDILEQRRIAIELQRV